MEIANVNPTMSIIKCEWSEQPNGKAETETVRLDKKIQPYAVNTRRALHSRLKIF